MSRSRNYDREFTLNDRLKKENAELKREVAKLRKTLNRRNFDSEQIQNPRHLEERKKSEAKNPSKSKKDWTCFDCARGVMQLKRITRRDGEFYLRRCSNEECKHQTKLKKYNDKVEQS
jgi:hypothetical protein